jgi:hypothetical protein
MGGDIKRWPVKRKTALILDVIQGKALRTNAFTAIDSEILQHASRIIGDLIGFYTHRRPKQALYMRCLSEALALAA